MSVESSLGSFAALLAALGGVEGVKGLWRWYAHRKEEKRIKGSEAQQSAIAAENSMRDMYEDALSKMQKLDEQRIAEITKLDEQRIAELTKANSELHKQNLELLKAGARKDEIIEDKTVKIRELQEARVEDVRRIGRLEKLVIHYKQWYCKREYGKGKGECCRREPAQNPPLKYEPIEGEEAVDL